MALSIQKSLGKTTIGPGKMASNSHAVHQVNAGADVIGTRQALMMNVSAAKGLQSVVASNLGPKGTLKMLVGGAGQIKLTKDGKVLLDEMQIQHPTAAIIARTATAQDDITGDGTTSIVLFTGELLKQAERYLAEGLHPRVLVEGFDLAKERTIAFLDKFKVKPEKVDRALLVQVTGTSLKTKLHPKLANHLTEIVVDAALCVQTEDNLDLHMVEIMHMAHKLASDTKFINGLVLDHGARHPNMAKRSENCFILTCNVSLEYEKSEMNASFFYSDAEQREKLVNAERKFTDDKVNQVIAFKKSVCTGEKKDYGFIVINQKGIDPISLDLLQKNGIVGIRRAKRRNMERLSKACGGYAINSLENVQEDCLGFADLVYEHTLGEDKYTFVEGCRNATSCTILLRGPNDYTIRQLKDAVRDGLRACKNLMEDKFLVAGAGAFEFAAYQDLMAFKKDVKGRSKIGIQAFADALLVIPKTLAQNSGLDVQDTVIGVLDALRSAPSDHVGLDLDTGNPTYPEKDGIWDNFRVKRQFLHLGSLIATKLLLVDEVMRAGRKMGGK